MADNVFDFDTSKDVRAVQAFERTLNQLDQTIEKLDRKDLNRFKKQIESLNDSPSEAMKGLAATGATLLSSLDGIQESVKKKVSIKGLAESARGEITVFRQQIATALVEVAQMEKKLEMANFMGKFRAVAAEAQRAGAVAGSVFSSLPKALDMSAQMNQPSRTTMDRGLIAQELTERTRAQQLYQALADKAVQQEKQSGDLQRKTANSHFNEMAATIRAGSQAVLGQYRDYYARLEAETNKREQVSRNSAALKGVDDSFRSMQSSVERGGKAVLAEYASYYTRLESETLKREQVSRNSAALKGVDDSFRSMQSSVERGSKAVIAEYAGYYKQLEADSARKEALWKRVNNPEVVSNTFRSLTASIEAGAAASAKALRDHYAELERISNVKSAINSRLAGASTLGPVSMPTDKISKTDANDAVYKTSMSNMRAYYESIGAIRNKDTAEDTKAAVQKEANANLITKAYAQVKAASIQASGVYSSLNSGKFIDPSDVDRMGASFRKLAVDAGTLHGVTRGLAAGFGQLWLAWGQLAPMLTGAGIGFGLKKTFDIGSEVEYNIKFLQVLGDQTKETGSAVRAELRAIDQTTLFSLTELSKGMVTLGQSGLSPKQSLETLRPAADLATAGMVDLDTSIKLLIQTNALFGKTSADTSKVAAQLFVATKSGVLNVEDLSGSMKYASEVNTRFGKSLEETLTLLGALAQAGLKGSSGGTALINFYRDINGRSGPAVKALETLRKVSGETIKIFDDAGKQRSGIDIFDEIAKASEKLSSVDADKILNKLFSDRGGRTFFAMVRDGTIDLKKMQAQLEATKPDTLFDAARGMMDTTKGAVDQLQGALVGQMDIVFEKYAEGFKGVIKSITAAINSNEFRAGLDTIVRSALALYSVLESLATPIAVFFGSLMAIKAVSLLGTIFTTVGATIAGAGLSMGAFSVATGLATAVSWLSVEGNVAAGAALFGKAAAARAAAAGEDANAIATARAAAVTAASTGVSRVAAGALGLLANPIVAVAALLAVGAAAWWSYSSAAKDATGDMSDNIVKNGAINIDQWNKEIGKLKERNALMASGRYADFESAINKAAAGVSQMEGDKSIYQKDIDTSRTQGIKEAARTAMSQYESDLAQRKANLEKMRKDLNSVRDEDAKREAAEQEKQRKKAEAAANNARNTGVNVPGTGGGRPGAGAYDKSIRLLDDNGLQKLQEQMSQRYVTLQKGYDNERKLLDARYKAGLMIEGEYQLESITQTQAYEKNILESRRDDMAKMETQYKDQADKIKELMATAQAKGATANVKELEQKLENLGNTWETYRKGSNEKIMQVEADAALRLKLSLIEAQGALRALTIARVTYNESAKARLDSKYMQEDLTEAYRFADKSVFSDDTANLAASQAQSAELGNHKQRLQELSKATDDARRNYDALMKDSGNREWSMEWQQALQVQQDAINANSAAFEELSDLSAKWGEEAGKRAYGKAKKDQFSDLSGGIADSVMTGLTEGGAAGAKSLKALIQKELINEPLRVLLQAQISGMLGGGASKGSSGSLFDSLLNKGIGFLSNLGNGGAENLYVENNPGMYGAFDVGTPYVPNDQVAKIHRGERIMTASENAAYNASTGQSAGNSVHFAPVMSIQIDARSDRAIIRKEVANMIDTNNKQTQENFRRMGWTDA